MIPIPSPRTKKRARIEIIPLIDIIFFLLATFVMVSLSMVKNRGVPVNLPTASTSAPQEHNESATVTITNGGALFFNKQPVDETGLHDALAQLLANDASARLFINGDTKAEFGRVIVVLDAARTLGITKVIIETESKPSP